MDHQIEKLIISKLDGIERELKEVRQRDIPALRVDMAIVKTESKSSAKVIAGIGGAITLAVSTAVAFFK